MSPVQFCCVAQHVQHHATKRYKFDYQLFNYCQEFVSDKNVSPLFGGKVKISFKTAGLFVSAGSLAQDPAFPDAKNSAGSSARDPAGAEACRPYSGPAFLSGVCALLIMSIYRFHFSNHYLWVQCLNCNNYPLYKYGNRS